MCSKRPHGRVCLSVTVSETRASGRPRRLDGGRTGCREGKKAAGAALSAEWNPRGHTRLGVCFCYWIIRQVSPQPPRLELIFCCSPSFARLVFFLSFSVSLVTTSHDYTSDQSSETVPTPSIPPPIPQPQLASTTAFPRLLSPWYSYVQSIHSFTIHFLSFHSQLCGYYIRPVPSPLPLHHHHHCWWSPSQYSYQWTFDCLMFAILVQEFVGIRGVYSESRRVEKHEHDVHTYWYWIEHTTCLLTTTQLIRRSNATDHCEL